MQLMDCGTAPGHQVYKNLTYAHNIQLYSDMYDISPILFVFYKYGFIFNDLGYILYHMLYSTRCCELIKNTFVKKIKVLQVLQHHLNPRYGLHILPIHRVMKYFECNIFISQEFA